MLDKIMHNLQMGEYAKSLIVLLQFMHTLWRARMLAQASLLLTALVVMVPENTSQHVLWVF